MTLSGPVFDTLVVTLDQGVAEVRLNRPQAANALNEGMWREIRAAFDWVDGTPEARVAVLSGAGKNFCSGIDLEMLAGVARRIANPDGARSRETLRRLILELQDCLSAVERCRKPVIAAIQGACVGGALDLVTCCDLRYALADAVFSVREIDLGMVADVGTLQRLPRLVGEGIARELAYTGHDVDGVEAQRLGLVNGIADSDAALRQKVAGVAAAIAARSPLAVRGVKEVMNFGRDRSVADGLNFVATWNASMLLSTDLDEAVRARREGRPPVFAD